MTRLPRSALDRRERARNSLLDVLRRRVQASSVGTSAFPVGAIVPYAGATSPAGWLLCDGTGVDRTLYKDLYDVIGFTYGRVDDQTFSLPDLSGKVPAGVDTADGDFDLADTGGAKTHALATSEIPSHSHGVTDGGHTHGVTDGGHTHTQNIKNAGGGANTRATAATDASTDQDGGSSDSATTGVTIDSGTTGVTIDNTGGGGAHNNMQPYLALNFIIKH